MRTNFLRSRLVSAGAAASLLLAAGMASATITTYYFTVDGKPPTTIDDLHLHFKIQDTPFVFGEPLIDDKGRFGKAEATIPGPDGAFRIDFDLADPTYGPSDNVHLAFNFDSSEDVRLVFAEWTFGGVVVGTAQDLDVKRETREIAAPATAMLVLSALVWLGVFGPHRRAA